MESVNKCFNNLPHNRENGYKESISGNQGASRRISKIPVTKAMKSKQSFTQDPEENKGCTSLTPKNAKKDMNNRTFTLSTISQEIVNLGVNNQAINEPRPNEVDGNTNTAVILKTNVQCVVNPGTVNRERINEETFLKQQKNVQQTADQHAAEISVLPVKYTAHSGMQFLPSPKKTLKPFSSDMKGESLRRSKTENITASNTQSFRHENMKLKMSGKVKSKTRSLGEKSHVKEAKRKTGDRPIFKKSISLEHQKLPKYIETNFQKPQVLTTKNTAYSGMKLLPKKITMKPFTFEAKEKPLLRRSKTENIIESGFGHKETKLKVSENPNIESLVENRYSTETKRKNGIKPTIRKSKTFEELDLSNITEATLEKSPISLCEYTAHSGLKFIPSPERTTVEPFSFDVGGTPRSKSNTGNVMECSFKQEKLKLKNSAGICNQTIREKVYAKDTKRKTMDVSKHKKNQLVEQTLADITKTVTEAAPVIPKNYAGHSGLTFKFKPKTFKRAFDTKPKHAENQGSKNHSTKPSDKEHNQENKL